MASDIAASRPLTGLRVIEFASYVAGPTSGVTLAQLGADVIRIDPLGGAPDITRWPLAADSPASLFWVGLNKGKRSVEVDVRSERGRELVLELATAPGAGAGLIVDNQAGRPWLSFEALSSRRADVIQVHIQGYADGRAAVDYTINPEVGLPAMTGAQDAPPVNHALPAWDLIAGSMTVGVLLAALRRRDLTGEGGRHDIALADVALAAIANMGWLTEAEQTGRGRERVGNYLYGSYGVDFKTRDGARVMVVALTGRQWSALVRTTAIADIVADIEARLGCDLSREGDRFTHRELITALVNPWFAAHDLADVERELTTGGVLWSRYRSTHDVVGEFRSGTASGVLGEVDQPGIGRMLGGRSPARSADGYGSLGFAPRLGAHSSEVLSEVLGLTTADIETLQAEGVVGGAR